MSVSHGLEGETVIGDSAVSITRRVFSLPVAVSCLLIVLATLTVGPRFDDPDMWWQLKTGEVIWNTHTIPTTDLFSYTTSHHAWIDHEWLTQFILYGTYKWGGYTGLMIWFCLCTSVILIGGYALCSLYSRNAKVAFVGALAIWWFGTIGFAIRPHMIGYILLLAELALLHLGKTRNQRWFWALPPLFALWINCHGTFFLGFALAGAFLFSSFFSFQAGLLVATPLDSRSRRTLTLALLLSIFALFVNPVGVKLILYPFQTLFIPSIGMANVSEWQPLQFGDSRSYAFLGVLGCIFLLVIVRRTQLFFHELVALTLATWLAASHLRLLFAFGILTAPILSRLLSDTWDQYSIQRDRVLPNAVLIALSLIVAFWAFPSRANLTAQVEEHSPVKAVEFIRTHHLSGPMFNEWIDGGYLLWAAPDNPVFVDGRGDIFEWAGVLTDLQDFAFLRVNPNLLLDKYKISFCLLDRRSQLVAVMSLLKNWQITYQDNQRVIFTRIPSEDLPTINAPTKN